MEDDLRQRGIQPGKCRIVAGQAIERLRARHPALTVAASHAIVRLDPARAAEMGQPALALEQHVDDAEVAPGLRQLIERDRALEVDREPVEHLREREELLREWKQDLDQRLQVQIRVRRRRLGDRPRDP